MSQIDQDDHFDTSDSVRVSDAAAVQSETTPAKVTAAVSVNDSGYQTSMNASQAAENFLTTAQSSVAAAAYPVHGTSLLRFKKTPDRRSMQHYNDIRLAISAGLQNAVKDVDSEPDGSFSMRPVVIGNDEATATLHLVVFCPPRYEYTVNQFFTMELAQHLLNLSQYTQPLHYIVLLDPPNLTHATMDVQIDAPTSYFSEHGSLCGAPVTSRSIEGSSTAPCIRQGTFGGTIKVMYGSGEARFYGMVAGHLVRNAGATARATSLLDTGDGSNFPNLASFASQCNTIGKALDSQRLPGVTCNRAKANHDWALVALASPIANRAYHVTEGSVSGSNSHDASHAILTVEKPRFVDDCSDPVSLLGAAGGPRRGELSCHIAQLWLSHSDSFVESYLLELDDGTGMLKSHEQKVSLNLLWSSTKG